MEILKTELFKIASFAISHRYLCVELFKNSNTRYSKVEWNCSASHYLIRIKNSSVRTFSTVPLHLFDLSWFYFSLNSNVFKGIGGLRHICMEKTILLVRAQNLSGPDNSTEANAHGCMFHCIAAVATGRRGSTNSNIQVSRNEMHWIGE